jgi:hypothetical protein
MIRSNHVGRVGLAVVLSVVMIWSACSTAWIGEAEQIVAALIPAASNILALVAAVQGNGISASDLQAIQNAGAQAGADLELIQSLITAYEKADAAAQPGILNQIESAISGVQGNLQGLLAGLHIQDAATQAKVTAVIGIVLSEVQSLAAVVPIVKSDAALRAADSRGRLSPHSSAKAPLSANEFVKAYNSTLTARTGDAELDRLTAGLQIHLHAKVQRVVTGGVLK